MNVPFLDLKAQYLTIKEEIDEAIRSVIDRSAYIRGADVDEFERAFAAKCGKKHCVSCANGTDAIYIILKAMGIGPGDEVITVANSWISTSETITQAGARPVFVDIDPDYYHIDPALIEAKITPRTRAVIPVHLFGQPAAIDAVADICRHHGLPLVEDCAQAHFAEYGGRRVGTFGVAGTFSFYPGKNLGAYGDAGALVTDDDELATRALSFANHGSLQKHVHEREGINSRLDGIQAAVLNVKLKYIDGWNEGRRRNAAIYDRLLAGLAPVRTPRVRSGVSHIYHLYVIGTDRRDELAAHLKNEGIGTQIHYPTALPLMPAYRYLGHAPEDFPVAARMQDRILSLPMYPELDEERIAHVCGAIKEFFQ